MQLPPLSDLQFFLIRRTAVSDRRAGGIVSGLDRNQDFSPTNADV